MAKQEGVTLAEALASAKLGEFEGADVRRAGVEIPNVAGGLRKAMKIQPLILHQGDRGWIAFEFVVEKIKFDPIDKDNPAGDQERIHVLSAEGVTFVDGALVADAIKQQKEAIQLAEEEAKGIMRLPDGSVDDSQAVDGAVEKKGRGKRGGLSAVDDPADPAEDDPFADPADDHEVET